VTDALRHLVDWAASNGAPQALLERAADELVSLQHAQRTGVQPETLAKAQQFMLRVAQRMDDATRHGRKLSITNAIRDVGYAQGVSEQNGWRYKSYVEALSSPTSPLAPKKGRKLSRSSTTREGNP